MRKTMGAVIAENRKAKGMTQLDLAAKMGVTDKAVSKWERDLSCPDINSLPQLSEALGLSLDELMQIRKPEPTKNKEIISNTICRAIALAMGIAVAVLSALGSLGVQEGMTMLGIGMACLALSLFLDKKSAQP